MAAGTQGHGGYDNETGFKGGNARLKLSRFAGDAVVDKSLSGLRAQLTALRRPGNVCRGQGWLTNGWFQAARRPAT